MTIKDTLQVRKSSDYDVNQEDADMSSALSASADAWIDLQKPANESEYLMAHLASRYEELFSAYLTIENQDFSSQKNIITLLIKQLSRAQSDIFVLKSILLGRDKLALSRDWEYQDPLRSYINALGRDARKIASERSIYSVPLDSTVIGFGWYPPNGEGAKAWRWSGPGLTSGLLIPRIFEDIVRIDAGIRVLKPDTIPETGMISIDGEKIDYTLNFSDSNMLVADLEFEFSFSEHSGPFFMMEFHVRDTVSSRELAQGDDSRLLGICLTSLTLRGSNPDEVKKVDRSRTSRIRIDPSPVIQESRHLSGARQKTERFKVDAGSTEFSGTGWYAPETDGANYWRWSGSETNSTILLPTLGGGRLRLTLDLLMPFGRSFDDTSFSVFVNDIPVALGSARGKSKGTLFRGELSLSTTDESDTFTLLLQSTLYNDPDNSPYREMRVLGVGLYGIVIDKISI